jgi:hypothetical protein
LNLFIEGLCGCQNIFQKISVISVEIKRSRFLGNFFKTLVILCEKKSLQILGQIIRQCIKSYKNIFKVPRVKIGKNKRDARGAKYENGIHELFSPEAELFSSLRNCVGTKKNG